MPDQPYHLLYPDEFDDAVAVARGAYMGTYSATGFHVNSLDAAIEEAFNAGVRVGREHADG